MTHINKPYLVWFKYWSLINNQHFTSTAPTKSYVCGQTQLLELWDLLASVSFSPPPATFIRPFCSHPHFIVKLCTETLATQVNERGGEETFKPCHGSVCLHTV